MREATANEFSAVRNYPNVEVRRIPSLKTTVVVLSYCGREVGQSLIVYTSRKSTKVQDQTYSVDNEFHKLITTGGDIEAWRLR